MFLATALGGCVTPPGSSEGHSPEPSTTITTTAVPCAPITPLSYVACAETTAPTDLPYTWLHEFAGSGTITEVGEESGPLGAVDQSAALPSFDACGPEHLHQIRLVDGDGETWTFGWDLGLVDDGSSLPFEVDDPIDFYAVAAFDYQLVRAVVLSDPAGPLFLLTDEMWLTDELRGGVTHEFVQTGGRCVLGEREYAQGTFTSAAGRIRLWPGEDGDLLGVRPLHVVLGDSDAEVGCIDGCTADWWAEWAE